MTPNIRVNNWVGDGFESVHRQVIIHTSAELLSNRHTGTNFGAIWSEERSFSFKNVHWKMSSTRMSSILFNLIQFVRRSSSYCQHWNFRRDDKNMVFFKPWYQIYATVYFIENSISRDSLNKVACQIRPFANFIACNITHPRELLF